MTDLELLIQTANNFCTHLDDAAKQEKKFTDEICHMLEHMAWDTYKMGKQLEEIRDYV